MNSELQWVDYPCTIYGVTYWNQKKRLSLLVRNEQGETLDIFAGKKGGDSPLETKIKSLLGENPTEDQLRVVGSTLSDMYKQGVITIRAAQALSEEGKPFLLIRMMGTGGKRVLL